MTTQAARATTAAGEVSRGGGPQQQHHDSDFLFEQKLESIRAALLCGSVGAASRLLAVGAGALIPGAFLRDWLATPEPTVGSLLFALAAGFSQGALFGLTYRCVIFCAQIARGCRRRAFSCYFRADGVSPFWSPGKHFVACFVTCVSRVWYVCVRSCVCVYFMFSRRDLIVA